MRVGVYVDAFNLYYGARKHCTRGTAGWRWLDIRQFTLASMSSMLQQAKISNWKSYDVWQNATIDRVVYCTAKIDSVGDPTGAGNQEAYLNALLNSGSVDQIEFGYYQYKIKSSPLAVKGPPPRYQPILVESAWPLMVKDATGNDVSNARFMVSHQHVEEKGSDVNVGSHLLIDTLTDVVDAAIVISNDSDLRYPVEYTRTKAAVGIINPHPGQRAGALKISGNVADSQSWNWNVTPDHFKLNQLPDTVGNVTRPSHW